MFAAIVTSLAILLPVALFGVGAMAVLAGAVMAVVAMPEDLPVEVSPRAAGAALAALGLLVFVAAFLTPIALVPAA